MKEQGKNDTGREGRYVVRSDILMGHQSSMLQRNSEKWYRKDAFGEEQGITTVEDH